MRTVCWRMAVMILFLGLMSTGCSKSGNSQATERSDSDASAVTLEEQNAALDDQWANDPQFRSDLSVLAEDKLKSLEDGVEEVDLGTMGAGGALSAISSTTTSGSSCTVGGIDMSKYPQGQTFVQDNRLKTPGSLPEVKFTVMNTGTLSRVEATLTSCGSRFRMVNVPVPCVLVQHPKGTFLFDTGLGSNIVADFKEAIPSYARALYTTRLTSTAAAQLSASGPVDPGSITTIIMSHLHYDHASGIMDFPNAEVWTTGGDYDQAAKNTGLGFIRSIFIYGMVNWQFMELQDKPYENFDQSLDWFGDGSVVLVPLPGHTPNLVGMFINMRSGKRYLFVSDAISYAADLKAPTLPWLVRLTAGPNQYATVARLNRLWKKYPDLVIISAHDKAAKNY